MILRYLPHTGNTLHQWIDSSAPGFTAIGAGMKMWCQKNNFCAVSEYKSPTEVYPLIHQMRTHFRDATMVCTFSIIMPSTQAYCTARGRQKRQLFFTSIIAHSTALAFWLLGYAIARLARQYVLVLRGQYVSGVSCCVIANCVHKPHAVDNQR